MAFICICTAEKMQITKVYFHVSEHKKLHADKNVTIPSIFKHFLHTAFYWNTSSVLWNTNSPILKFPEHAAGKMDEYTLHLG